MNRGNVLPMVAGGGQNNWWSSRPPPAHQSPFFTTSAMAAPPPPPLSSCHWHDHHLQHFPESLSQLLMSGLGGEEDRSVLTLMSQMQEGKKLENWEEVVHYSPNVNSIVESASNIKQENTQNNSNFESNRHCNTLQFQANSMIPTSSPTSCITSLLEFSNNKPDGRHPPPDRSSEYNSTATGGATKKAKIQPSSTQSTFKVRKEKLGDRITALHQLVSPFGKTDTASVLLEAIGYIRFLQNQIEALSLPYLGSGGSRNMRDNQHSDFHEEAKKDLRSRGLCLVPVSCTMQVGGDTGADYWTLALN